MTKRETLEIRSYIENNKKYYKMCTLKGNPLYICGENEIDDLIFNIERAICIYRYKIAFVDVPEVWEVWRNKK